MNILEKLKNDKKQYFVMTNQNLSNLSTMSLGNSISPYVYTDEQLIALFQKGDEKAYVELVNRYRDRLMNFVFQYLGDMELAEDIVQDTMLKLYQKKHYYKQIAKFSTWIYTIAKNLAFTELRRKKSRKITVLSQMNSNEKDYEIPSDSDENNTYLVNLIVSDGSLSTTLSLTITVTDVNEPTALSAPENIQTVETQE
ncbi:sigma-70 family RNA polymerase sigma factor [uncultured Christiangramia sp.]|uniref:sigma-70 family RNA polymerase sigma factor n=1 Tax=uncultured Christiangramia sp. TaxID=503836 RepID=UPI0025E7B805|nr:sigma-70 family RNA polymerase sigma factor [uncultured Christiangramia sp.]